MWYVAKHKRSWWKKHGLDILTAIGLFMIFAFPLAVMFMK